LPASPIALPSLQKSHAHPTRPILYALYAAYVILLRSIRILRANNSS
jgi:hypothetical protein